jgi:hypothetical protein
MLPGQAPVRAYLSAGVGNTTVVMAAGAAVRLERSAGLGNSTFPAP